MASFKSWVSALRPRTLFLALASTICGNAIAYSSGYFSTIICILTILIATLLQLTSNMANDLGDFQHGTDTTGNRVGPTRTVQSGAITPQEMKNGIIVAILISICVGCFLIYTAISYINIGYTVLFAVLGVLSIWAAVKYTAGKNPYGYKGMGDIFSFVFFGPVAIVGTYFLHVHQMTFQPWLPSFGIGFFTAAVLNINNMRDMDNDLNSGKITLAIKLGKKKSRVYHAVLTWAGIACFGIYAFIYLENWYQYLYMIFFIPFLIILTKVNNTKQDQLLDPYLKKTSIATFVLSIVFAVCINL